VKHLFIKLFWIWEAPPPSNAYLSEDDLSKPEQWYPLRVLVCNSCWLVQTDDFAQAGDLFDSEYAYFSSYSTSWLAHAKQYAEDMCARFELDNESLVVEVAANDGYLLQYFQGSDIPCYGIEPTASTAAVARERGIEVCEEFFGKTLAEKLLKNEKAADLIAANNVLAHVPDINDFVSGFATLLKDTGVATFEFPHLLKLVKERQFDTIYHEHYSYLTLSSVNTILSKAGLSIFDAEELPTHGGSLRVYAQRNNSGTQPISSRVAALLEEECNEGVTTSAFYAGFQEKAEDIKDQLLNFLLELKSKGKSVGAYGAAAKGNTLLNFAGVRPDLLPWVVDLNPAKQGHFLPGSRIPIVSEDCLRSKQPDYIIILPWNLREEIVNQLEYTRKWDVSFVTFIPELLVSKCHV
jgi:SAM-dependent methyltransferase